ncbi:dNTP triphosphohydrolase [Clostridium perfringens]|nr:dNTP triphosphohydrolase [Clostridium perfringens]ELC8405543.1 dNTP triphosphohydrolase [Clostridium perfringens]
MEYKLSWDKLFCCKRERKSSTNIDHRNEFEKDYDRIVSSSSVRRLQDKAQVFPLQENDFTRTRLTHSIEASAISRSLGVAIEKWLLEQNEINKEDQGKLPALLQVSALIHDLGNPPFGHYGEDIIKNWFNKWLNSEEFNKFNNNLDENIRLKEEEKSDFINFEGNAQTLRIVTKLQLLNDQYGVNFTYGTLATIMKYPWSSSDNRFINEGFKKFGYFWSEKCIAKRVQKDTGLNDGIRHPATFLLEASDDIAYLCADIEDGVKKGVIPWNEEYKKIKEKLVKNCKYEEVFKDLDKRINNNKKNKIPDETLASIQNFKISVQRMLFEGAVKSFKENYDNIMKGKFEHNGLIDNCGLDELVEELKSLAIRYCFVDKEVLTLELVGDTVINGLLDIFVSALIKFNDKSNDKAMHEPKAKTREGKLYNLISPNFKYVCSLDYEKEKKKKFEEIRIYDKLLLITDFISGMTDSYAVNLYKELLGVRLP